MSLIILCKLSKFALISAALKSLTSVLRVLVYEHKSDCGYTHEKLCGLRAAQAAAQAICSECLLCVRTRNCVYVHTHAASEIAGNSIALLVEI